MKISICVGFLVLLCASISFAGNYVLTIDGETYDVSLGEELSIKVGERSISAQLEQKNILTYTTNRFSFEHSKEYSPSKSDLGSGIYQTAMMTPLGVALLVQEYTNISPSGLLDHMVNEVTKGEKAYGYKIDSTPISMTSSGGTVLTGLVVTSKYKDSDIKRFFYTYSKKDEGLLIMTQIDYQIASDDQYVIDQFFNSLKITMN